MNSFKSVRVPVASHGLHRHPVKNVSSLGTNRFFAITPYMWRAFKKGEKIDESATVFCRMNPLLEPAFVTGHLSIKSFFVPYTSIFKGWYDFDSGTIHNYADGSHGYIPEARYVIMDDLNSYFSTNTYLCTEVTSSDPHDFTTIDSNNVVKYYTFTNAGSYVFKVFCALGLRPNWDLTDHRHFNCMAILAYLRIVLDRYFPASYVNNSHFQSVMTLLCADSPSTIQVTAEHLVDAVNALMYCFYENSVWDSAFDNPVSTNIDVNRSYIVNDSTNNASVSQGVYTRSSDAPGPSSSTAKPSNGTPFIGTTESRAVDYSAGVITQFVLDSLQSINNFIKRNQLAGGRLIDRFLLSRGVSLSPRETGMCYLCDSYSLPFKIGDVENNTDTYLGELAGKGVACTDTPIKLKQTFDDDGIFMLMVTAVPDAEIPVALDPYCFKTKQLDFHHSEFDKLGVEAVSAESVYLRNQGHVNKQYLTGKVFGFLNRYYSDAVQFPRLFGDFLVPLRGATQLAQYHTFRDLGEALNQNLGIAHSYDFLRTFEDATQYNRLFYTKNQDQMVVLMRFDGACYLEKLPLGDSYDWDDDEFNRKVEILTQGSRLS